MSAINIYSYGTGILYDSVISNNLIEIPKESRSLSDLIYAIYTWMNLNNLNI